VVGTFPVAAEPACCANEAAGEAKTTKNAQATFTEVFDMGESSTINTPSVEVDVGVRNPSTPLN
jgi:hypothetical protein